MTLRKHSASTTLRTALWLLAAPVLATWLTACAGDKKGGDEPVGGDDDGGGGGGGGGGGNYASANRVTLTNSLSNNPLTSQTIASGKAEGQADKFSGSSKDKRQLEGKVSAERLARKPVSQVMGSAKKLAELEMEKSAGRSIGDDVKLELALAAIGGKNYALGEYYLQALVDSKNARIKAGAFNALGVVALKDDRVPEAVLYFREALKSVGNYKPAMLNLGFAALKGGDLTTAKRMLGDMGNDWFVQYGLLSVARMEGNDGRAAELCDKVLSKEPNHKAALANCGLVEAQNKGNLAKAHDLLGKAQRGKGGEPGWDEKIAQIESKIDQEEAQKKSQAQKKKAAADAADKAKAQQQQQQKAGQAPAAGGAAPAPKGP